MCRILSQHNKQLMSHIPSFIAPTSHTDPEAALEQVRKIYNNSHGTLPDH